MRWLTGFVLRHSLVPKCRNERASGGVGTRLEVRERDCPHPPCLCRSQTNIAVEMGEMAYDAAAGLGWGTFLGRKLWARKAYSHETCTRGCWWALIGQVNTSQVQRFIGN